MNNSATYAPERKSSIIRRSPVMLCFFAMGFVDLVGTASNYVQKDLNLSLWRLCGLLLCAGKERWRVFHGQRKHWQDPRLHARQCEPERNVLTE